MPVLFPCIEIGAPDDPESLADCVARLPEFDLIVFISPSAVEQALPLFAARHPDWAAGCRIAAVGQGSRAELLRQGLAQVIAPSRAAGAAGLLELPELAEALPRKVLIVRGVGGREELAEGLRARGAQVEYAECYRRVRPAADASPLLEHWRQGGIGAVTVTSIEILDNLMALLGAAGVELLRRTPMFVHHPRIAEAARARGIGTVIETAADEAALVEALMDYFDNHD